MTQVKLSKSQKGVIKEMRIKADVFRWIGMPVCKFSFKGITYRYDLGSKLQSSRLIEAKYQQYGNTIFQLSELGKTIQL